jgi:hypothetical protein
MPRRVVAKKVPLPPPQPHWTEELKDWKVRALTRVLQQLSHVCSGPQARPKSFCLTEVVRHVVAQEIDPDSLTGRHLSHLLTVAVAREVMSRSEFLPHFQRRFRESFSQGSTTLDEMRDYVSSRWWLDNFVRCDEVRCGDVAAAVQGAILATVAETAKAAE